MKKKYLVTVSLILLLGIKSHSIRSVGTGGGEAEKEALQQIDALPLWLKFCRQASDICIGNAQTEMLIEKISYSLIQLPVRGVKFFGQGIPAHFYEDGWLILLNNELYLDQNNRKSSLEISNIIINRVLSVNGVQDPVDITLPVNVTEQTIGDFAFISGQKNDFIFNKIIFENVHQQIEENFNGAHYRVQSNFGSGYLVKNLNDGETYIVMFRFDTDQIRVITRLYSN